MNIETLEREYQHVTGRKGYSFYRKIIDGRGVWYAVKGDRVFPITYEQAQGYEPIDDVESLSMRLGSMLLPRR